MSEMKPRPSPGWGNTMKLVVALAILTIIALLLTFYHTIVGPLLVAFVLSYLLHPIASALSHHLKMPWGVTVNIIYLVFILFLLFLLVWGGFFIINQSQGLVSFIQDAIKNLPSFLSTISKQKYYLGPFVFDTSTVDISSVVNQILNALQNVVGQIGFLLGTVASSTAVTLGWIFFVVMISYFILNESKGAPEYLSNLNLPGYEDDLRLLEQYFDRIWNAFLRGQMIVTSMNILLYTCLLGVLGVQYFYVLAFAAGIARFIPYLGAWLSWATFGLVAFFQGTTIFGLSPLGYSFLVVGLAIVVDTVMDNYVTPQILSNALQVHPAAVMVAALVGFSWLGIVGVILAAPVLATLKLFGSYALMKLLDKNPWQFITIPPQRKSSSQRLKKLIFKGYDYFLGKYKKESEIKN
jgi:predicted PurR-regulated permease PerM